MSTLVGDGLENPGNASALVAAASMFGWDCAFLDRAGLGLAPALTKDELLGQFSPLLALENAPGADSIHGFTFSGPRPALLVGNERKGIDRDLLQRADRAVRIPLASRRLDTINVAAAAAVALYYMTRGGGGKLRTRAEPNRHRPEVLFLGPGDAIELGSALRSAAAFGWGRVFVEDRSRVWFGTDRVMRSLGRGAARRSRNAIHVLPFPGGDRPLAGRPVFDEACVVTRGEGEPLHRVDVARGPGRLLVIADEGALDLAREDLGRLARDVRVVSLDLPRSEFPYRFKLTASIALAEAGRQVGVRLRPGGGRARPPFYDRALPLLAGHADALLVEKRGVAVALEDLPL
jgi:hypothetical protein